MFSSFGLLTCFPPLELGRKCLLALRRKSLGPSPCAAGRTTESAEPYNSKDSYTSSEFLLETACPQYLPHVESMRHHVACNAQVQQHDHFAEVRRPEDRIRLAPQQRHCAAEALRIAQTRSERFQLYAVHRKCLRRSVCDIMIFADGSPPRMSYRFIESRVPPVHLLQNRQRLRRSAHGQQKLRTLRQDHRCGKGQRHDAAAEHNEDAPRAIEQAEDDKLPRARHHDQAHGRLVDAGQRHAHDGQRHPFDARARAMEFAQVRDAGRLDTRDTNYTDISVKDQKNKYLV